MKSKIIFSITILLLSNVFLTIKPEQMETMTTKNQNEQGKIKLFVYNGCPWCKKVIAYLKQIGQFDKMIELLTIANANAQKLISIETDGFAGMTSAINSASGTIY